MSRVRRAALTAVLAALPAAGSRGAEPAPAGPGVRVDRDGPWTRIEARLPGALLGYALPRVSGGGREIVVLVEPREYPAGPVAVTGARGGPGPIEPAGPPSMAPEVRPTDERLPLPPCPDASAGRSRGLYRIGTSAPARLVPVPAELPGKTTAVDAADLDGDGQDELLVARPGNLSRLSGSRLLSLVDDPGLFWRNVEPRAIRHPELEGEPLVPLSGMGELRLYGPGPEGDPWSRLAEVDLPVEGSSDEEGLRLSSPPPRLVGRRADGTLVLATLPEAAGQWRLKSLLIELSPRGEAVVTECWMRFPSPEEVLDRSFLMLDGRPLLVVATKDADRLSLFEEKLLRIFPMEADRSRSGNDPLLATDSTMNLWQPGQVMLRDVDGDGLQDLVIGYWKGLRDDRIVLDAYVRRRDGTFPRSPRTTAFDVEDGDRSFLAYGPDVDGDGLADLVILAGDAVQVHPGLPSTAGKRLVHREPVPGSDLLGEGKLPEGDGGSWRFGSSWGPPRFSDLDGDGRDEMIFVEAGGDEGPAVLRVISLDPQG